MQIKPYIVPEHCSLSSRSVEMAERFLNDQDDASMVSPTAPQNRKMSFVDSAFTGDGSLSPTTDLNGHASQQHHEYLVDAEQPNMFDDDDADIDSMVPEPNNASKASSRSTKNTTSHSYTNDWLSCNTNMFQRYEIVFQLQSP